MNGHEPCHWQRAGNELTCTPARMQHRCTHKERKPHLVWAGPKLRKKLRRVTTPSVNQNVGFKPLPPLALCQEHLIPALRECSQPQEGGVTAPISWRQKPTQMSYDLPTDTAHKSQGRDRHPDLLHQASLDPSLQGSLDAEELGPQSVKMSRLLPITECRAISCTFIWPIKSNWMSGTIPAHFLGSFPQKEVL